jgi:hypothetical protein
VTVWLTPEQVSERTGFSVDTLRDWRSKRNEGKGPPFLLVGSRIRYEEAALEQWQAQFQREAS